MFNVIRADLVKLKKSFWFKLLMFLWVISFSLIYMILYYLSVKNTWENAWFFHNIIWINQDFYIINLFLYTFIVFWFSLFVDSINLVDKDKNLILFTKNIRIKYYLSKIFITIFFSFIIIFLISLLSSLSCFITLKIFNLELFNILFIESFTKLFIFYISIIPLLILFVFFNLIWIRSLFIWILIIFVFFSNFIFWEKIQNSSIWKYYKIINDNSLLWNYNNIIQPIFSNKDNYKNIKINEKYLNLEGIKNFEITQKENEEINKKIKPLFELLNNPSVIELKTNSNWNTDFLAELWKQNPDIQKMIDNLNEILDWSFTLYNNLNLYDRFDWIYQELWWEAKYYELNQSYNISQNEKLKVLNSKYYLSISSNFWNILKNFFSLNNRDFNVWFLHIIFIILIWSIIIKRRQVYN